MVGQRVGNYQILERLGEGGMATVYLASHPELGRRVAVKVLHLDLARNDEMIQRFFNEARAANAVGHRGIVEVSDIGVLPSGAPYIVMELLEGERLADRMTKAGRLALAAAVEIARQAADAVGAAHAKGIIHRDLKPDNLYLIPDPLFPGRELLKVLDFGIAKLARRPSAGGDLRTRTGTILGTPRYMSPEQFRESRDVDHRSDVYSLGVVLYEMLSGAPPFVSGSWGELAHMHIGVSPPALRERVPDVPEGVVEVVSRALEKDPEARFRSMAELDAALEVAARSHTLVPRTPPAGSTLRLEDPAPTRAMRRTTLAGAASEILPHPRTSKRTIPVVPALTVAAATVAAIAIVVVLTARRAPVPGPRIAEPAAGPRIAEPAPARPAPIVELPPASPPVITPSAVAESPDAAPPDRDSNATPAADTKPAHRSRPPAKPAASKPAPPLPEPLKI